VTLLKNADLRIDRECRGSAQTIHFVWFLVKTNRHRLFNAESVVQRSPRLASSRRPTLGFAA